MAITVKAADKVNFISTLVEDPRSPFWEHRDNGHPCYNTKQTGVGHHLCLYKPQLFFELKNLVVSRHGHRREYVKLVKAPLPG